MNKRLLLFVGIFMSFGPIIEEVQTHKYMNSTNCAKARQLLLIIWLFVAFTLTISYKEVLIANLVNIDYEQTIDNFDDLIDSGIPLGVPANTQIPSFLENDPRQSAKALLESIVYYNYTKSGMPLDIVDG